jgi:type IX secretion system PorP/SprF family membrane protein
MITKRFTDIIFKGKYKIAKTTLAFFVFITLSFNSKAQDIQFSQFYANVLYMNPAFAGSAHLSRAIFHQRIQWPTLDAKYITSSVSFDHYFEKAKSGLGVLVLKDWQGANTLSSTEMALQYAYELSVSNSYSFRAGFEANYVSRFINYNYLTLPDQYNNNGFNNTQTQEPFGATKTSYLDFSVGGILYSDKFWLGVTSKHLTQPDQSFYKGTQKQTSPLPIKLDFATGYKIFFQKKRITGAVEEGKEVSIAPTAHYKLQGKSDQVDLGVYGIYDHMIIGGWYRGIPVLKQYRKGLTNNESIVLLVGWKVKGLSVSYSYDFTISKLVRARTGGSHELNVTYVWGYNKNKKKKPMRRLPCPDFKRSIK